MKIAQIAPLAESVPPKLYGGTQRVVSYLAEELVRLGHDVTLFAAPERAARVAQGLFDPEFFSGWGIRTVNRRERRFNPASYHNGSVWPHDNAIIALGLARYGHCSEALALTTALFDAAAHMHLRRLPELFCVFARKRGKAPTLYPVDCAPQAWAAVTPFALIQACLGLDVDCGAAKLRLRKPRMPHFLDWMAVKRLQIGGASVDLMLRRHDSSVAVNLLSRDGVAEVEVMLQCETKRGYRPLPAAQLAPCSRHKPKPSPIRPSAPAGRTSTGA